MPPTKFAPYKDKQSAIKQSLILLVVMEVGMIMAKAIGTIGLLSLKISILHLSTLDALQKFAWENLKENSGPNQTFLDLEDTPFDKLQEAIDTHSHIFVTADSTSMIRRNFNSWVFC